MVEIPVQTPVADPQPAATLDSPAANEDASNEETPAEIGNQIPEAQLGRGHRTKKTSSKLQGYVTSTMMILPKTDNISPVQPTSSNPYPLHNYLSSNRFSSPHCSYLAAITDATEPNTFGQAMKDSRWCIAMQEETKALEEIRLGLWLPYHQKNEL